MRVVIFYDFFIVVELNDMQKKKASMTPEQDLFVQHLLSSQYLSPESTVLVECVAALFPRRYSVLVKNKENDAFIKRLKSKAKGDNENPCVARGEGSVKNLVIDSFKRKIQTHHFNIVQIAYNMGKLAG